ncbi:MAG: HD domain-containing protein [Spirochaetales bacterium]
MTPHDRILSHIERDYNRPVRDPLWKHIYLSDGLMRVIDTSVFQKLSRIKQLGPTFLVYPGATHTRLNHSLGVFHIGRIMIRTLLTKPQCPDLTLDGAKAFLAACLLHDLGHFPYTHSLKELPLREHEQLTGELVTEGTLAARLRDDSGTDPEIVRAIVDETVSIDRDSEISFYRSILSGTLDPDKLDYLNRDAYFCGVPYGLQDIDFAVSRIQPTPGHRLGLDGDGVSAVENILFSKYLMYRAVYWHRTVRVATAMIKKGLYQGLRQGEITPQELYGLDDEQFFARFSEETLPAFRLIENVPDRRLHKTVVERAWNSGIPSSPRIETLDGRAQIEQEIAAILSPEAGRRIADEEIIVDLPEAVSFEISMPVSGESSVSDYPEAGTVFTPGVIQDFTKTLRRLRLMVSRELAESLSRDTIARAFDAVTSHY